MIDVAKRPVSEALIELWDLAVAPRNIAPAAHLLGAPPLGPSRYAARSDDAGRFCFSGRSAGQYLLRARKRGLLDLGYGATNPAQLSKLLDVDPAHPSVVTVELLPAGSIAGRARGRRYACYQWCGAARKAGVVSG